MHIAVGRLRLLVQPLAVGPCRNLQLLDLESSLLIESSSISHAGCEVEVQIWNLFSFHKIMPTEPADLRLGTNGSKLIIMADVYSARLQLLLRLIWLCPRGQMPI